MLSYSTSPFPWLPPLNSHPNYVVHITTQQTQSFHQDFATDPDFPELVIDFHIVADFYSEDQTKTTPIRGLDHSRTFFIPCYPEDTEPMHEADVQYMLSFMTIQFPLRNLRWENMEDSVSPKNLFSTDQTGQDSSITNPNPGIVILESEDELTKTISAYMNRLISLPRNNDLDYFPVCLRIVKKITISDFEFEAWVSWREEQARVNPNFRSEYMTAIARPRFRVEMLERETRAATSSSVAALESWEIDGGGVGSSPVEAITCSICLDEVVFGTRATRMPCSHVFHEECIVEWLKGDHTCPLCRFSLPFTNPSN